MKFKWNELLYFAASIWMLWSRLTFSVNGSRAYFGSLQECSELLLPPSGGWGGGNTNQRTRRNPAFLPVSWLGSCWSDPTLPLATSCHCNLCSPGQQWCQCRASFFPNRNKECKWECYSPACLLGKTGARYSVSLQSKWDNLACTSQLWDPLILTSISLD